VAYRLRASECRLAYGIPQCYLPTNLGQPVLDLPAPDGRKTELTWMTGCIPRWFSCSIQAATGPGAEQLRRPRPRRQLLHQLTVIPRLHDDAGSTSWLDERS